MSDAWTTTRTLVALGAAALGVTGCNLGGDQPSDGPGNGFALQQPAVVEPEEPAAPAREVPAAAPKPQSYPVAPLARIEERALRHLRELRARTEEQEAMDARAHARATLQAVRDLTDAVMLAAGLEFATFDVIDGGRRVTVTVAEKDACLLGAGDPTRLSDQIIDGSNIVDRVSFRLASGGSLGAYLAQHCKRPSAQAGGLGPVLLSESDKGMLETAPFKATRSGWTIDWTSYSGLLQIYVYRDGKLVSVAANQSGRGAGQERVLAAGTYTLQVAATGAWKVTVRDGAPPRPPTVRPLAPPTSQP